jgi:microcystin-dependent protein
VVPQVPIAALAVLVGVDRFMSECRALTNLVGNGVATLVVARWEMMATTVEGDTGAPTTGTVLAAAPSGTTIPEYGPYSGAQTLTSANATTQAGGSQAHENMQPYLGVNFIIALYGIFPSQN